MELQILELDRKRNIAKKEFYIKELKNNAEVIVREEVEFKNTLSRINQEINAENAQQGLLSQHLKISQSYYRQKLDLLRESEERCSMQCEDFCSKLRSIREDNEVLESSYKNLGKILQSTSKLEGIRESNDWKLEKYSLLLRSIGKHIKKNEKNTFENYTDKLFLLCKEVQSLEQSVTNFRQEALQDPRKTMPYLRSATPLNYKLKTNKKT